MSRKAYNYLIIVSGIVCTYVLIKSVFFIQTRLIRTDVIQGVLVGFGLAIATAYLISKFKSKKTNGWSTLYGCGEPDSNFLQRAACALAFPGPINTTREAMYWTTSVDGANHTLSGTHNYILHFPAGGLPPNHAFWSLTMGDAGNRFVANPINRYSVSDRSGLIPNADGSVDIHIRNTAPERQESNWLPAPAGEFILWLRVYMPDDPILSGKYIVPPVTEVW
ncbi:MAG: DUF1214 domain-containing protein [Anaerofustis sp.]